MDYQFQTNPIKKQKLTHFDGFDQSVLESSFQNVYSEDLKNEAVNALKLGDEQINEHATSVFTTQSFPKLNDPNFNDRHFYGSIGLEDNGKTDCNNLLYKIRSMNNIPPFQAQSINEKFVPVKKTDDVLKDNFLMDYCKTEGLSVNSGLLGVKHESALRQTISVKTENSSCSFNSNSTFLADANDNQNLQVDNFVTNCDSKKRKRKRTLKDSYNVSNKKITQSQLEKLRLYQHQQDLRQKRELIRTTQMEQLSKLERRKAIPKIDTEFIDCTMEASCFDHPIIYPAIAETGIEFKNATYFFTSKNSNVINPFKSLYKEQDFKLNNQLIEAPADLAAEVGTPITSKIGESKNMDSEPFNFVWWYPENRFLQLDSNLIPISAI